MEPVCPSSHCPGKEVHSGGKADHRGCDRDSSGFSRQHLLNGQENLAAVAVRACIRLIQDSCNIQLEIKSCYYPRWARHSALCLTMLDMTRHGSHVIERFKLLTGDGRSMHVQQIRWREKCPGPVCTGAQVYLHTCACTHSCCNPTFMLRRLCCSD